MAAFTTLAFLAFSAYGAYSQYSAQKEQKKVAGQQAAAQEQQAALEKRRADIQNTRTLRANLRQSRIQAAQVVNVGAATSTLGSSGVSGGLASLGAQEGSNVGFFNQQQDINQAQYQTSTTMANLNARMGGAQGDERMGGTLFNIGMQGFGARGGFKSLFGG